MDDGALTVPALYTEASSLKFRAHLSQGSETKWASQGFIMLVEARECTQTASPSVAIGFPVLGSPTSLVAKILPLGPATVDKARNGVQLTVTILRRSP